MFRKLEVLPPTLTGTVFKGSFTLALLALLLVGHGLINYWWLQTDRHALWLDEQVYHRQARLYSRTLFLKENLTLPQRIENALATTPGNPAHPPLLYVCGAMVQGALGFTSDSASLVDTAAFMGLLAGVFCLARLFFPYSGALFATVVASFLPGLSICSRYFMTDYPAACFVVWAMYALIRSEGFHEMRWSLLFVLFNVLGLLTRTVTPLYYLVPLTAVVITGFLRCLGGGMVKDEKRRSFGIWCFHLLLVGFLSIALTAPWYYYHRDRFFGYWLGERAQSKQPFTLAPILPILGFPQEPDTPEEDDDPPPVGENTPKPEISPETPPQTLEASLQEHTPWIRYPIFVINNGTFLIPGCLAVLGFFGFFFIPRKKWHPFFLLLGWVLGSWVLFSLLFRFGTPRYALPVLAPLAIFSVFPLLAVAGTLTRTLLCSVYLIVLIIPWIGLTFRTIPEIALPCRPDPSMMAAYDEKGLYLAKDHLTLGYAYAWLGAPAHQNYQDRIYRAMLREEMAVERPEGQYASYAVLNLRGMGYQDKQYWPAPNPYRRSNIPEDIAGVKSKICLAAHANNLEELALSMESVSYVVYALEEQEIGEEGKWRQWLTDKGLKELDHFQEPRRATNQACVYGVWGKTSHPAAADTIAVDEIARMDIVPLLRAFGVSDSFVSNEALEAAQNRLTRLLARADRTAITISPSLTLTSVSVEPLPSGESRINFVFNVQAYIDREYILMLKGVTGPEEETAFRPSPATRDWTPGTYMLVSYECKVPQKPAKFYISLAIDDTRSEWIAVPWPQ